MDVFLGHSVCAIIATRSTYNTTSQSLYYQTTRRWVQSATSCCKQQPQPAAASPCNLLHWWSLHVFTGVAYVAATVVTNTATRLSFNQSPTTHKSVYLGTLVYPVFLLAWLWLDPMTLIHELDIDIIKKYMHTWNELTMSRLSKVKAQTRKMHRAMQLNAVAWHIQRWLQQPLLQLMHKRLHLVFTFSRFHYCLTFYHKTNGS